MRSCEPASLLLACAGVVTSFLAAGPVWAADSGRPERGLAAFAKSAPDMDVAPSLAIHSGDEVARLAAEPARLQEAGLGPLAGFLTRSPGAWEVRWDVRSDRPHLIQGGGYPLLPGKGNRLRAAAGLEEGREPTLDDVERLLRAFIEAHAELLQVNGKDLRLDRDRSHSYDGGRVWFVELQQVHQSVPVEGAAVFFRINSGNIVQFGTDRLGEVTASSKPALSQEEAFARLLSHLSLEKDATAERSNPGTLKLYPSLTGGESVGHPYEGQAGQGYTHRLAWEFVFRYAVGRGSYRAIVDAQSGDLVMFEDMTREATVRGGVYPRTNTDPEEVRPFPFTAVSNNGAKVTDANGSYTYSGGTATSNLDGRYARIVDFCGDITLSDSATGDLHFGSSGGRDCITPGVGGAGNTHAARTAFYHLTRMNRKATAYLPNHSWLSGPPIVAFTNEDDTICNAFSNGSSLEFFRFGTAQTGERCSNSGEIADIAYHEWGHSMDFFSGGEAPEKGTGEAVGDTFSFLETHDGCIGPHFYQNTTCHNCPTCSGVRDVSAFAVGGPRTIARPTTVTADDGLDCDNTAEYDPCGSGYAGPMGYQGHCESYIASTANWDLSQSLVSAHGPQGWTAMERIWYGSLATARSAYRLASGGQCNPNATVDGCGATNWYTLYLALDDDDGNLGNGTPNGCRIWDAFDAHGIACGSRPACTGSGGGGGGAAPSAPTNVKATPVVGQQTHILVTWQDTSNNEDGFRIFRLRSGPGETPHLIKTVPAGRTSYLDDEAELPEPPDATAYYFYTIKSFNDNGQGISERAESRLYLDSPGTPSVLNPRNCIETLTPQLTWQGGGRSSQFYVRLLDGITGDPAMPDATPTEPRVQVPGSLTEGRPYHFRVRGLNNQGTGPWSDFQNFMPSCQPLSPPMPQEPFGCVDTLTPTLAWSPVDTAQFYLVNVARVTGTGYDVSIGTLDVPATWVRLQPGMLQENLVAGQEYRYWVKAHNGGMPGPISHLRYFTPLCPAGARPGTAALLSPAGTIQTASPAYMWEKASLATSHRLRIVAVPSGSLVSETLHAVASTCTSRECSVSLPLVLAPGQYYFQVWGRNAAGEGPLSDGSHFTVPSLPVLSVGSARVIEGQAGTTQARFPLQLSAAAATPVTVHYATADETAAAGEDYTPKDQTLSLPAGATSAEIVVDVLGDAEAEADETFLLRLDSPQGAVLAGAQARGTIVNDDAPVLRIEDVARKEAENGWQVPVRLDGVSSEVVTVTYGTAACTATAGEDFHEVSETLTFPPGASLAWIPIEGANDKMPEGHELFTVALSNPVGATLGDASGIVTSINDDVPSLAALRSDFDRDGNNDLVVLNPGTRGLFLWSMLGVHRQGVTAFDPPAPLDAGWRLAGMGDFNADSRPDLVWRNDTSGRLAFWFMDGVQRVGSALVDGPPDTAWSVAGIGAFNQDRSPDILFRNATTGSLMVWLMDGVNVAQEAVVEPSQPASAAWKPQGVADLDSDGGADILFRNDNSGALVVWLMEGTVRRDGQFLTPSSLPDLNWRLAALLDIDADRAVDLVWQNQLSGRIVTWLMDDLSRKCGTYVSPDAPDDPSWRIAGPR